MALVTTTTPLLRWRGTVAGVRITDAAGANLRGDWLRAAGCLRYSAAGTLAWRAPGDTAFGTAVDVSAGGAFVLSGTDTDRWLAVHVTPAARNPTGASAHVQLVEAFAGPLGGDVATGDRGAATNWTVTVQNRSASAVTVTLWLDAATRWYELSSDGSTWSAPTTSGAGIVLNLSGSGTAELHLRRTVPAGAAASAGRRVWLRGSATDGVTTEAVTWRGWFRVVLDSEYRIFRTATQFPRPDVDTPVATTGSLPYTESAVTLADGRHYHVLVPYNGVFLAPRGQMTRIDVAGGAVIARPPASAQHLVLENVGAGVVRVHTWYPAAADLLADRATHWKVEYGVVATPWVATTVEVTRNGQVLAYDLPAQSDGVNLQVRVTPQRGTGGSAVPADASATATLTVAAVGPSAAAAVTGGGV